MLERKSKKKHGIGEWSYPVQQFGMSCKERNQHTLNELSKLMTELLCEQSVTLPTTCTDKGGGITIHQLKKTRNKP